MRNSTKLALILILSLIWALATMVAVSYKLLIVHSLLEVFMVSVPFVSFFCTVVLYTIECKNEANKTI
jgi:hypothetical protein